VLILSCEYLRFCRRNLYEQETAGDKAGYKRRRGSDRTGAVESASVSIATFISSGSESRDVQAR
jgi:hypothetical protein